MRIMPVVFVLLLIIAILNQLMVVNSTSPIPTVVMFHDPKRNLYFNAIGVYIDGTTWVFDLYTGRLAAVYSTLLPGDNYVVNITKYYFFALIQDRNFEKMLFGPDDFFITESRYSHTLETLGYSWGVEGGPWSFGAGETILDLKIELVPSSRGMVIRSYYLFDVLANRLYRPYTNEISIAIVATQYQLTKNFVIYGFRIVCNHTLGSVFLWTMHIQRYQLFNNLTKIVADGREIELVDGMKRYVSFQNYVLIGNENASLLIVNLNNTEMGLLIKYRKRHTWGFGSWILIEDARKASLRSPLYLAMKILRGSTDVKRLTKIVDSIRREALSQLIGVTVATRDSLALFTPRIFYALNSFVHSTRNLSTTPTIFYGFVIYEPCIAAFRKHPIIVDTIIKQLALLGFNTIGIALGHGFVKALKNNEALDDYCICLAKVIKNITNMGMYVVLKFPSPSTFYEISESPTKAWSRILRKLFTYLKIMGVDIRRILYIDVAGEVDGSGRTPLNDPKVRRYCLELIDVVHRVMNEMGVVVPITMSFVGVDDGAIRATLRHELFREAYYPIISKLDIIDVHYPHTLVGYKWALDVDAIDRNISQFYKNKPLYCGENFAPWITWPYRNWVLANYPSTMYPNPLVVPMSRTISIPIKKIRDMFVWEFKRLYPYVYIPINIRGFEQLVYATDIYFSVMPFSTGFRSSILWWWVPFYGCLNRNWMPRAAPIPIAQIASVFSSIGYRVLDHEHWYRYNGSFIKVGENLVAISKLSTAVGDIVFVYMLKIFNTSEVSLDLKDVVKSLDKYVVLRLEADPQKYVVPLFIYIDSADRIRYLYTRPEYLAELYMLIPRDVYEKISNIFTPQCKIDDIDIVEKKRGIEIDIDYSGLCIYAELLKDGKLVFMEPNKIVLNSSRRSILIVDALGRMYSIQINRFFSTVTRTKTVYTTLMTVVPRTITKISTVTTTYINTITKTRTMTKTVIEKIVNTVISTTTIYRTTMLRITVTKTQQNTITTTKTSTQLIPTTITKTTTLYTTIQMPTTMTITLTTTITKISWTTISMLFIAILLIIIVPFLVKTRRS